MDTKAKRIHFYHADAHALGGHLERPISQPIPILAPLSLSPVGGYSATQTGEFAFYGVISIKSAHTQVSGSRNRNGAWTTLVTATVEGLNILEFVSADRVVAQISIEHPLEGYHAKVTFAGTHFENLRIAGHPVEPVLRLDLCSHRPTNAEGYPTTSCLDKPFTDAVEAHYAGMTDPVNLPKWVTNRTIPSWVQDRYRGTASPRAGRDVVVCSLVKEIRGEFPGIPYGHAFEVPEFGKAFLAELVVDHNSYQLTMIRLELGCGTDGSVNVATGRGNGTTYP